MTEATELHRSLAVDFGSVSSQWNSALRQLIIGKQPETAVQLQQAAVVAAAESLPISGDSVESSNLVKMIDVTSSNDELVGPQVKGRILHL